jgi:hypothetical protein
MNIRTIKLHDEDFGNEWFDAVLDQRDYADMKADARWRKNWISFDCALYDAERERIYLGITSFDSDIFKAYDIRQDCFVDLGYGSLANEFEAKFHRSLVWGADGCVYAAIALLHDVDNYWNAPGSPIVKYDPRSGAITKLGVVVPHVYIQSIAIDNTRNVIYCLCLPPERLAKFDLNTGTPTDLGLIGNSCAMAQGENVVIDDDGCLWSNWAVLRAWQSDPGVDSVRLCKYDPKTEQISFLNTGLPRSDGSHGFAKAEALFNFGDGFLYASGANGSFYRIDTQAGKAEYLFTPTPERPSRLSSLAKAEDGIAYGVTGREGKCELMRINYKIGTFEKLGPMIDQDGKSLWQNHDIVITDDGILYVCENDNPYRSSYLWEVKL